MASAQSIPCRPCKGKGFALDIRHAAITHRAIEIKRLCQPCKGTGQVTPTALVVAHDTEIGETPEWMLDGESGYDPSKE